MVKKRISAKKIGSEVLHNDIASATSYPLHYIYIMSRFRSGRVKPARRGGRMKAFQMALLVVAGFEGGAFVATSSCFRPHGPNSAHNMASCCHKIYSPVNLKHIKQPTTNAVFRVERQRLKIQILYYLLTVTIIQTSWKARHYLSPTRDQISCFFCDVVDFSTRHLSDIQIGFSSTLK